MGEMYDVHPSALKRAAKSADDVARTVRQVSSRLSAEHVGTGMRGSSSVNAATTAVTTWKRSLNDWARDAGAYADELRASANAYHATDDRGSQALRNARREA